MEKTTLERDIDKIKDLIENADTILLSYKESDFDSKEAKSKLVELLNDGVKRENWVPFLKELLHSLEWINVKMKKLEDGAKDNIKDVLSENRKNPFPKHKGYTKVWTKLTPKQQEEMEANIKIASDGGIEIPKMKEKYSILLPKYSLWKKMKWIFAHWKKWNSAFISGDAKKEIRKQGKYLDSWDSVEKFIDSFPWETTGKKIQNCIQIFELENSPIRDNMNVKWERKNMRLVMVGNNNGPDNHSPIVLARNVDDPEDAFIWSAYWDFPVIASQHLSGWNELNFPWMY